jgi:hypothetical protein
MTAFLPISAHPTAKGEAIDMDRFVNDQNLDSFRRLVFCSEAERKILLAEEKIKFIELQKARSSPMAGKNGSQVSRPLLHRSKP